MFRRSRKRRSNRRKTAQQTIHANLQNIQNVCNTGITLNDMATTFDGNPNSSYVINQNAPDNSSPSKKRKISSQDVPGPSSYYTKGGSSKEIPMTEFYHSLLESSYHDDFNRKYLKLKFLKTLQTDRV